MATAAQTPALALLAFLDELGPEGRDALARSYIAASTRGGATVLKPDGQVAPIPPLLTPEVLDARRIADLERNAHALLVSLNRLTGCVMTPPGAPLRSKIFRSFGALEAAALASTWHEAERLATARVDYLVDENGTPRALEVNATIPAMQGYSDIVAAAFVRELGRVRGASDALVRELLDDNGRNADQLLESLLAHDRLLGPRASGSAPPRIAIVARAGDAQVGELRYLAARFSELGCPTIVTTPGELRLEQHSDGERLATDTFHPDLVYRHVFARRLDPASDFARALMSPRRHRILNPVASHHEVKAMLGLLSAAASDEGSPMAQAIGLDDELRAEIARSVPWTRVLLPGAARGPEGEAITELVATVAAEPERFVLKRSWDYGGRSVFLGADHDDAAAARAGEVLGTPTAQTWRELVHGAAGDERDAWVVQALVPARPHRHLVASDAGAAWRDLYVDLSVYTNLGVDVRPCGGVSRAAPRRIVNLLSGGGLAPLIKSEVLGRLLAG